ncbi:hypothetical protein BV372_04685 [Nostoc sp. T09]|uniref:restriction endonuclease subunit S n=1 Tax=Nostoc sp. T09 TaxID=1932621 RepID=UPI000A38BF8B|nr:restriction endonuclease subunit S [Nostoc sp. T09]OUL36938.1 hypothetical protein BV372_04685 [Nostoc sp. T09]
MKALVSCDRNLLWLGDLEKSVTLMPLKYVTQINAKTLPESTPSDFPIKYIDIGSVDSTGKILQMSEFVFENSPSRARRKVIQGDTIVSTVRTYLKAISYVEENNPSLIASTGFAVLSPIGNILNPRYLYYWMRSSFVVDEICARSIGVSYPATNASEIGSISIPVLPLEQQSAIASFLDRKTVAIATLIDKKQRLIELLEEKRNALINQAVTKGLNPNVPMKDSGISGIGEVPEHWRVKIFKRVTSRIEVGIAEAATHAYTLQGVPIVRSGNVKKNYIDFSDILYIEEWFAEKNRSKYLRKGDILTVRTGANAGMTAVVPEELNHAQCFTLLIATLNPQQFPLFYSYYINSSFAQSFFTVEGWGSAQVNLSVPILQTLPIVEPPYKEQEDIVSFIQKSTVMIDKIITKNKETIEKLQEYRQTLITAAVTGKIDVREEVTA